MLNITHCRFFNNENPCEKKLNSNEHEFCVEHVNEYKPHNLDYIESCYCSKKISAYLDKISTAHFIPNKIIFINELFNFIIMHKKYILLHTKFSIVTYKKLLEFKSDPHANDINLDYYIEELFPQKFVDHLGINNKNKNKNENKNKNKNKNNNTNNNYNKKIIKVDQECDVQKIYAKLNITI